MKQILKNISLEVYRSDIIDIKKLNEKNLLYYFREFKRKGGKWKLPFGSVVNPNDFKLMKELEFLNLVVSKIIYWDEKTNPNLTTFEYELSSDGKNFLAKLAKFKHELMVLPNLKCKKSLKASL